MDATALDILDGLILSYSAQIPTNDANDTTDHDNYYSDGFHDYDDYIPDIIYKMDNEEIFRRNEEFELLQAPWDRLRNAVYKQRTNLVKIDNNQFITIDMEDNAPIYNDNIVSVYDDILNEWQIFLEHEEIYNDYPSISYDKETNSVLYIGLTISDGMLIHQLLDGKPIVDYEFDDTPCCRGNCCILEINNQHHIILGDGNPYHLIFDLKKPDKLEVVHKFKNCLHDRRMGHKAIFVKNKNIILLFGGREPRWNGPRYNKDLLTIEVLDTINEYSFVDNKWKLLHLKMPIKTSEFGCVITSDDKYILFFGGKGENKGNEIYILDLDKMEFFKSRIKCPRRATYDAVLLCKDDWKSLILLSYIHKQQREYKINIPNEIVHVISMFICYDCVHLIPKNFHDHYQIMVTDILSN